ncbi:hypothetical protein BDV97DRAFT_367801 [Delphinella strobiligena]|nr:hypothetical protein BDV97DRAFT_367801 [Delphinella strobiligena]
MSTNTNSGLSSTQPSRNASFIRQVLMHQVAQARGERYRVQINVVYSSSVNANVKNREERRSRQPTRPRRIGPTPSPSQKGSTASPNSADLVASILSSGLDRLVQDFDQELEHRTTHQNSARNMRRQSRFSEDLGQSSQITAPSRDATLRIPFSRDVRPLVRPVMRERLGEIETAITDFVENNRIQRRLRDLGDIGDLDAMPLAALRAMFRNHQFRSLVPKHQVSGQQQRKRDKEWGVLKGMGHSALGDPDLTYNGRRTLFDYAFNQLHVPRSRATGRTGHDERLDWGKIETYAEPYFGPLHQGREDKEKTRMITAGDIRKLIALL